MKEIKMPYEEYEQMKSKIDQLSEIVSKMKDSDDYCVVGHMNVPVYVFSSVHLREYPVFLVRISDANKFQDNIINHKDEQIECLKSKIEELQSENLKLLKKPWWKL